jgi:hypothetical protein
MNAAQKFAAGRRYFRLTNSAAPYSARQRVKSRPAAATSRRANGPFTVNGWFPLFG